MLTIHGMDVRMIDTIRPMSTWECVPCIIRQGRQRRGGAADDTTYTYTRITQPLESKKKNISRDKLQSETYSAYNAKKGGERDCRIKG